MNKVKINHNSNGDTRTADHIPTYEEVCKANEMHIEDVEKVMSEIGWELLNRGHNHDITKSVLSKMFYDNMIKTINGDIKFEDGEWANIHYNNERHHLRRVVPEDVNFIDILEMICDCVCAGKARSGKDFVDVCMDYPTLLTAYENTVKMINEHVVVKENDSNE